MRWLLYSPRRFLQQSGYVPFRRWTCRGFKNCNIWSIICSAFCLGLIQAQSSALQGNFQATSGSVDWSKFIVISLLWKKVIHYAAIKIYSCLTISISHFGRWDIQEERQVKKPSISFGPSYCVVTPMPVFAVLINESLEGRLFGPQVLAHIDFEWVPCYPGHFRVGNQKRKIH